MFLSESFLERYPDFAPHQTEVSKFVYLRTYSRYLPKKKRREVWKETPARAVNYNVGLELKHRQNLGLPIDMRKLREEAERLYDNVFNLRQFLSGRTMWVGGAETSVADKFPLANFNCSFTNIEKWEDLVELFYLLLIGVGVGFKVTKKMAQQLPPLRNNIFVYHKPYNSVYPHVKVDKTSLEITNDGTKAVIKVGDSKEGWCDALKMFLQIHHDSFFEPVTEIEMDYDYVRKAGERLNTFGGTASGAEPLMEMFQMIEKVIKNQVDLHLAPPVEVRPNYVQMRPVHIMDMANSIGYNVVVGGVRRTAEIFLFDPDDYESMFAKYGINGFWDEKNFKQHEKIGRLLDELGIPKPGWWDEIGTRHYDPSVNGDKPYNFGRPLHHRRMSNNSIAFTDKPSRKFLNLVFNIMQGESEPGFVNLRELAKRRFKQLEINDPTEEMYQELMYKLGMNPCAEIDLLTKGVCNLTTVNVRAFVHEVNGKYVLDYDGLMEAQRMSARAGLRMTLVELELPEWNRRQQIDRLLGCSLTGWQDAMDMVGYSMIERKMLLRELHNAAREEANKYAKELRVNAPLLVTTVKPEGTLSWVANGVSNGLHMSHAPYYIRRIRVNAKDAVAQTALRLKGWVVNPEVGTSGETYEERMSNARTLVIDFPVKSGAKRTKDDVTVEDQFNTYFMFQKWYTEHNSSNTITIKAEYGEWEKAEQIVWDNWDEFAAVSFAAHDGGTYELAPYESITEEEYLKRAQAMEPFNAELLQQLEMPEEEVEEVLDMDCSTGACPIR